MMGAARTRNAIVVFGSSGNLASEKMLPSLRLLEEKRLPPGGFRVVGVDRVKPKDTSNFPRNFAFVPGDFLEQETYARLSAELARGARNADAVNCLFYMAVSPRFLTRIVGMLHENGLASSPRAWRRIIVEKPFGTDRESARDLERALASVFRQSQIFRIDHFLGKEAVQNILPLRFDNPVLESVWDRKHIDSVQILVDEDMGIEGRAGYYDDAGVLRDMIPNHLLQILCHVAMERPASFKPGGIWDAKVDVLKAMPNLRGSDAVFGQYDGYRGETGVPRGSQCPTFVAMKLRINNDRWSGVPFYLRTGKMMRRRVGEVVVTFRAGGNPTFGAGVPERLLIRIRPDRTVRLSLRVKAPGSGRGTEGAAMEFTMPSPGTGKDLTDHERLVMDAMRGDHSIFVRRDFNDLAWRIFDPALKRWEAKDPRLIYRYARGSWGPRQADALVRRDGRRWEAQA